MRRSTALKAGNGRLKGSNGSQSLTLVKEGFTEPSAVPFGDIPSGGKFYFPKTICKDPRGSPVCQKTIPTSEKEPNNSQRSNYIEIESQKKGWLYDLTPVIPAL